MTIITTTEEIESAQWPYLASIFEGFFAVYGGSRHDTVPQFSRPLFSPSTTHFVQKKCPTAKGTTKESGKKKGGQQLKEFLKNFGESTTISCRIWPIALLSIFMMWPHQVIAGEFDCSIWGRKPNDSTLDYQDVFSSLLKNSFNGHNMSYNKICCNAFAYAPVRHIILSFNNVSSLPENLFRGISNLEEVELQGNPLTEVPSVLNRTKTIRFLNLADTKIGVIPKYSINGMSGVMVLDLSRTEITDVPGDIFDMSLRLVHLSQTKLDRLPLPPPTSAVFNVTLVGTHGTELSISYPDSGKRKIGINITGIETLTCEDAKTAVESSYCVLAGEIECDDGSFRKINILLKGKSGFPPSCTRKVHVNTNITLAPVPNRGAATPFSNSCKNTVSLHLFIGSLVIVFIIGALFVV